MSIQCSGAPKHDVPPSNPCTESGVFYLVPNKRGQGKSFVRRPYPPPTSPPLDDDFDAITQGCTTTRGPETEWGTRVRESGVPPTSPGVDDDFDAVTYTVAPGHETVTERESEWNTRNRPRDHVGPRRGGPSGYRDPDERYRKRNASLGGFENYGEYGEYMNEMERMFGGSVDLELSVTRVGQNEERNEGGRTGRVRSMSGSSLAHVRRGMGRLGASGKPSGLGPGGRRTGGTGPRPGQDYEVVNRHIVEDGPERTVTISTWREHVAKEADPEVEMSVYYVSADDYAVENDESVATAVDSHAHRTRKMSPQERRGSGGRGNSGGKGVERGKYAANGRQPSSEVMIFGPLKSFAPHRGMHWQHRDVPPLQGRPLVILTLLVLTG